MRFASDLRRALLAGTAIVACMACGGKVPPTNYYALNLSAPAPAAAALEHTAVLMPMRAGRVIRQGRIVYRESPEQVGFYEYHRWAEDPADSVGQSLLRQIMALGTFASIAPFDGVIDAKRQYRRTFSTERPRESGLQFVCSGRE